jgi:TetR/AcrR family transcriptional repressor of nem operon
MRYEKGHKEATRKRIIAAAAQQLRKDGLDSTGVAGLMAQVGLTHGGFYSHFPSKDKLIEESLRAAVDQFNEWMAAATENDKAKFEAIIRAYLSTEHRDHPENGCIAAALAPEIARYSSAVRRVFTETVKNYIEMLTGLLPASAPLQARQSAATAIISSTIGILQLARAVDDKELSDQILENGINGCLSIARSISA